MEKGFDEADFFAGEDSGVSQSLLLMQVGP